MGNWADYYDEYTYKSQIEYEDKETEGIYEGNENLCLRCKLHCICDLCILSSHFGYDAKGNGIAVACNSFDELEDGDNILIDTRNESEVEYEL